jgi:hypothetical protein
MTQKHNDDTYFVAGKRIPFPLSFQRDRNTHTHRKLKKERKKKKPLCADKRTPSLLSLCQLSRRTLKKKAKETYHTGEGHAIRLSLGVHALAAIVHSHAVAMGLVARSGISTTATHSAMTIGPLARQGAGRGALRPVLGIATLVLLVMVLLVLVLLLVLQVVVVDRGDGAVIPEGHCVEGHVELVGRHNNNCNKRVG